MNTLTLPTVDEEIWRYSRIGELNLDQFNLGKVTTKIDVSSQAKQFVSAATNIAPRNATDIFEDLNVRHAQLTSISVAKNQVVVDPIVITHSLDESGVVAYPRLVIEAHENSEVTVVERFISSANAKSLIVPVVDVRAAQSARVTYVAINELGASTWQIGYQQAIGQRDSMMKLFTVALGGDYARMRAEVRLEGQGANSQQVALYFADANQMHDFRTLQDHAAPRTHSSLLFKGAVKDTSKSVYTGLIRIRENATKSEAFQTNRNLTLSNGAWAESVPNLEIETNDVKCSHASTVGPIDEEQRFYLESRGIQPDIAERLVVLGFFDEVLNRLPALPFVSGLRERVSTKLLGAKS
ncbi:MAG: Fe-S cluster assembly protein SufD [Actinobacteria bacterium]|nr:Fe-S cluster assembly protein SufD [Actinomycetota bacterium]